MKLEMITLTGADDNTDPDAMFDLSRKYQFIEWGILLSKSKMGTPRFPSASWLIDLVQTYKVRGQKINISVHLCGSYLRELLLGNDDVFAIYNAVFAIAKRVQLNVGKERQTVRVSAFKDTLQRQDHEFIFQLTGGNDHLLHWALASNIKAVGLFDASGGRGKLRNTWPTPNFHARAYGYAGGLNPVNVDTQLTLITKAVAGLGGTYRVWIDAETHLRSLDQHGDIFDLNICEDFVQACERQMK